MDFPQNFQLSKASGVGCTVYEEKLPADPKPLTAEGSKLIQAPRYSMEEDYELLMAIKSKDYDKIKNHPLLSPIGHFTDQKRNL